MLLDLIVPGLCLFKVVLFNLLVDPFREVEVMVRHRLEVVNQGSLKFVLAHLADPPDLRHLYLSLAFFA